MGERTNAQAVAYCTEKHPFMHRAIEAHFAEKGLDLSLLVARLKKLHARAEEESRADHE